ncbi:hypothetical protein [Brevundimonas balnearis]|uniref:UrcA family protein n=1 Tax=Brevundimonas balnearis TaxID=1572858 RepID=A0ABV6R4H9_9CAUL
MMIIALAALALTQNPNELRIPTDGLDLHADRAAELSRRVDVAVDRHCRAHAEILTPTHMGDLRFCRDGLRRQVIAQLPPEPRQEVWRAGRQARVSAGVQAAAGRP